MRNRDARASHAVEANFASGSFSQRLTPTSWPTGSNEIWIEVLSLDATTMTLDSSLDYLDRHLILSGQFHPCPLPNYVVPNGSGATNQSNRLFPLPNDVFYTPSSVFQGDVFYTSRGWDGTTPRGPGFSDINNFAQPLAPDTKAYRQLFVFVNPFTGALLLKNATGSVQQGVLHVKASPQLNALVSVP